MKRLTLVPIGGLANRFYAVASAIAFCRDNRIDLRVIWFEDKGMGASFHRLFDLDPSLEHVTVVDAGWADYVYDRPRKRNLWLPGFFQKCMFDACVYESDVLSGFSSDDLARLFEKVENVYLVHYCRFYEIRNYGLFFPVKEIQALINQRTEAFEGKRVIGLHIRRGDHSIPTLKSPLSLFIQKMEMELEKDKEAYFYVASDSAEEKNKLISLFGERVITAAGDMRRDTLSGIIEALVELSTLSKTRKIYGSLASTYSCLASDLSSIPLEILSVDGNESK